MCASCDYLTPKEHRGDRQILSRRATYGALGGTPAGEFDLADRLAQERIEMSLGSLYSETEETATLSGAVSKAPTGCVCARG